MTRPLTARQREILEAAATSPTRAEAAKRLGLSLRGLGSMLSYISSKTAVSEPDSSETPAEAKVRIACEVARGLRCHCLLLLPCYDHGGQP